MKNALRFLCALVVAFSIASLRAQTPAPRTQTARADADQPAARSTLQWPPGYIEPNTPNMKYVTPETPQGTGPYKAIMATGSGAKEFMLYYPGNLNAFGIQKMLIVLWG